jgi:hypothetical protein
MLMKRIKPGWEIAHSSPGILNISGPGVVKGTATAARMKGIAMKDLLIV